MKSNKTLTIFPTILFIILSSCGNKNTSADSNNVTFKLLDSEKTGISFNNDLAESDEMNQLVYHYSYNGGGVASGDINNDGLEDLFFAGNQVSCKLYVNKGNLKFEDITEKSGTKTSVWCTGVCMVDVNNDGWQDIYVCVSGPGDSFKRQNLLFINNKNNTFKESAAEYGLNDNSRSSQATFFDMDSDGDLDVFIANHGEAFFNSLDKQFNPKEMGDKYSRHKLYENIGNKFTDISSQAGVGFFGYGLSATVSDYNNDGKPDIFVANDYFIPDYLFINNGNKTFEEQSDLYFKHTSMFSMGSDAADINNDGLTDLFVADMMASDPRREKLLQAPTPLDNFMVAQQHGYKPQFSHNVMQMNNGKGFFSETAFSSNIARSDWSWAPLFADFDNDGNKDLYITNGYMRDVTNMDFMTYQGRTQNETTKKKVTFDELAKLLPFEKLVNCFYHNTGGGQFTIENESSNIIEPSFSTGSVYSDLDNDGDLDLVVSNLEEKAFVYENQGTKNHFINIKLVGGNGSNTNGIGAKIALKTDSSTQFIENIPSRGYLSSVSQIMHFGFNANQKALKLEILWPSGKKQVIVNPVSDQQITLDEKSASTNTILELLAPAIIKENPLYTDITASSGLNFTHQESDFPDYKFEFLKTKRHSQEGPGIAVGDVNGDGLDDVFIGSGAQGSKPSNSTLFIQKSNGTFQKNASQPWQQANVADAMGVLFFDADSDGDNDLYIVSGGSEYNIFEMIEKYQDRLFINDGKGNFNLSSGKLPVYRSSGTAITAADFDSDGDIDLFRAGGLLPGKYPYYGASYLLQNNNGVFSDVTKLLAPDLEQSGSWTSAIFTDFNKDAKPDLVLSGEWLPIIFCENSGGKFVDKSSMAKSLNYYGFYNSVMPLDFDADGDMDYVAGNAGSNSYLTQPAFSGLNIYFDSDIDDNGTPDFFVSYLQNGKEYPAHYIDQMAMQMPSYFRKKFTSYSAIAGKTVEEIFIPEVLKHKSFKANYFSSLFIKNNGNGLDYYPLPDKAQVAPIYGMAAPYINNGGYPQMLLTGNSKAGAIEWGYNDAMNGLLMNYDNNTCEVSNGNSQGFYVPGDAKSLATIRLADGSAAVISSSNQGNLQVFKLNKKAPYILLKPNEFVAEIELKNGKNIRFESGNGGGYLSQQTHGFFLEAPFKKITITDFKGNKRIVNGTNS